MPDLYLNSNYGNYSFYYEKIRYPLCLLYKSKYCKRLSTLKSSLCCSFQALKSFYDIKVDNYDYYFQIKLILYTPITRVWKFGLMANFIYYRTLTKKKKLEQRLYDIINMIDSGMESGIVC